MPELHPDPWLDQQTLANWVRDARRRLLSLIEDLDDRQLQVPKSPTVNPLDWETGHVAWFQENWVLRHGLGRPPLRKDADALYDSIAVGHDGRWDLPLPPRQEWLSYARAVQEQVLERLESDDLPAELRYFIQHTLYHEDMHAEAFLMTRQACGLPAPHPLQSDGDRPMAATNKRASSSVSHSSLRKDHVYSASSYALGATPAERFVFDNEKWAHSIELETFGLRSTAVTQGEFAAFVNDRGYQRREWWSQAGWRWKQSVGAEHPIYWRRDGDRWQRRVFDRWLALQEHAAMVHVNAYEAEAWCAWADRRLPTEAEWERAAGGLEKQRYPWSEDLQEATDLRMDWCDLDCGEVDDDSSAHESDRPLHLLGNVWEWTASDFRPFPGFIADPYADYSQPWFRGHRVLRGGSWATRSRMIRNTLRNFYTPDRRDAFAGFRTCPR